MRGGVVLLISSLPRSFVSSPFICCLSALLGASPPLLPPLSNVRTATFGHFGLQEHPSSQHTKVWGAIWGWLKAPSLAREMGESRGGGLSVRILATQNHHHDALRRCGERDLGALPRRRALRCLRCAVFLIFPDCAFLCGDGLETCGGGGSRRNNE